MAIDGEPKNGDYVRYVDGLVNRGAPAPGAASARNSRAGAPGFEPLPSPGEVTRQARQRAGRDRHAAAGTGAGSGTTAGAMRDSTQTAPRGAYPAGSPARDLAPDNGQAEAMRTGSTDQGAPPSLAARAAQRRISSVVFVVALLLGWHAVRVITSAIHEQYVDTSAMMPGLFLLAFAVLMIAMSRNVRRNANRTTDGKLPPLTTVQGNRPGPRQ